MQAVLGIGAAFVLYLVPSIGEVAGSADRTSLKVVGQVLRDHRRVFATAGIATIAIQIVRASKDAMIPLWGDHIGLTAGQIALIFGLTYAADMTLFYPVGVVMDRFGRKWAGVPCLVMVSVGLIVIPFTRDFIALLLAGLLIGFGNGLGAGINMTLGSDFSPRARRAEFLGAWRLVSDVGRCQRAISARRRHLRGFSGDSQLRRGGDWSGRSRDPRSARSRDFVAAGVDHRGHLRPHPRAVQIGRGSGRRDARLDP